MGYLCLASAISRGVVIYKQWPITDKAVGGMDFLKDVTMSPKRDIRDITLSTHSPKLTNYNFLQLLSEPFATP